MDGEAYMTVRRPIVAVSGGMDPLHVGHIRYIQEAAQYGDVHVYLNTDEWLTRKKGFYVMPFKDRAEILWSMKGVTLVIPADDADGTVCNTIRQFKPNFFAKGGDRGPDNTPELELCGHLGIEVLFGVGGGKIESSTNIVNRLAEWIKEDGDLVLTPITEPWGR